jgi:hypothetical protein
MAPDLDLKLGNAARHEIDAGAREVRIVIGGIGIKSYVDFNGIPKWRDKRRAIFRYSGLRCPCNATSSMPPRRSEERCRLTIPRPQEVDSLSPSAVDCTSTKKCDRKNQCNKSEFQYITPDAVTANKKDRPDGDHRTSADPASITPTPLRL